MKKLVIITLVLACSALMYAFSPSHKQEKKKETKFTYYWWDYIGWTPIDQADKTQYIMDDDQVPDCSPVVKSINCEVYALKDSGNPDYPDLTTVIARRYPM
jgi:hypothetical protein